MPGLQRNGGTAPAPWGGLARIENHVRRLVEEPFPMSLFSEPVGWTPAVEVSETDGELTVSAELPGMKKEDVEIELAGGVLTLRGVKKSESETEERSLRIYERSYGSFQRSFALPCPVKEDAARAEFEAGVLRITLPKAERSHGRKVEIA